MKNPGNLFFGVGEVANEIDYPPDHPGCAEASGP